MLMYIERYAYVVAVYQKIFVYFYYLRSFCIFYVFYKLEYPGDLSHVSGDPSRVWYTKQADPSQYEVSKYRATSRAASHQRGVA